MNIKSKVQVIVRKRPASKNEQQNNEREVVEILKDNSVIVKEVRQNIDQTVVNQHHFNFDASYGENSTNEQIYQDKIRALIEAAFQQYNVSVFTHGKLGSGKTYTHLGDIENKVPGLYQLACKDIFNFLELPELQHLSCWVSFYEVQGGQLFDLMNNRQNLQLREDQNRQINIVGLYEKCVTSQQNLMKSIEFGIKYRIKQVSQNLSLYGSQAVLQIKLKNGENEHGKISFVDLPGWDNALQIEDQNIRKLGADLSKTLLAVKECIRAYDQNKKFTPYRGCKLTYALKDYLLGNCRIVIIGNVCPCQESIENTLNTLRYVDRIRIQHGSNLLNHPIQNIPQSNQLNLQQEQEQQQQYQQLNWVQYLDQNLNNVII